MDWRLEAAYRNFPYAPPKIPGAPFRQYEPEKPFDGAKDWQCSVYYYWWEYLRRHEGYERTCLNGGRGKYAKLYRDFGDVHSADFLSWWADQLWLFTFVGETKVYENATPARREVPGHWWVRVPLGRSVSEITERLGGDLNKMLAAQSDRLQQDLDRAIRYKVAQRPVLKTLHRHLRIWDARKQYPGAPDEELLDIVGLEVSSSKRLKDEIAEDAAAGLKGTRPKSELRRAKRLEVQRSLRVANQYIENVVKGEFPKRSKR
jgi:hypothetical protein